MNAELTNYELVSAINARRSAEEILTRMIRRVQSMCQHIELGECPYMPPKGCIDSYPPMRMCFHCGLCEEGWGPGYRFLTSDRIWPISREAIYKLRQGMSITNLDDAKGRVIRKEVTCAQYLATR